MKSLRILVTSVCIAAAVPAFAVEQGNFQAAVDLHPIIPLNDNAGQNVGFAFDVRGGYAMPVGGITLVPELVVGWTSFGTGSPDTSMTMVRVLGGARAVFGEGKLTPAALLHFGYGSLTASMEFPSGTPGAPGLEVEATDDTGVIELGGALDYAVTDNFFVGGHAGLNFLTAGDGATYLAVGAQLAYRF